MGRRSRHSRLIEAGLIASRHLAKSVPFAKKSAVRKKRAVAITHRVDIVGADAPGK
jgi:hypothetical protein